MDLTEWKVLVRRSFGVPDIVSAESANRKIEAVLHDYPTNAFENTPENPTMEHAVRKALAWAGSEGILDDAIAELDADPAAAAVCDHACNMGHWTSDEVRFRVRSLSEFGIENVCTFVDVHRFDGLAGTI